MNRVVLSLSIAVIVVLLGCESPSDGGKQPKSVTDSLVGRWVLREMSGGIMGEHRVFDSTDVRIYTFTVKGERIVVNMGVIVDTVDFTVDEAQRIVTYVGPLGLSDDIDTLTSARLVLSQRIADGYQMKFTKLDVDK